MKKILLLAMVLGLLMSRCASQNQWTKQDYSKEQFNADSFACEKDASSMVSGEWIWAIPYAGIWMGISNSAKKNNYYNRCMMGKGYEIVPIKKGE